MGELFLSEADKDSFLRSALSPDLIFRVEKLKREKERSHRTACGRGGERVLAGAREGYVDSQVPSH